MENTILTRNLKELFGSWQIVPLKCMNLKDQIYSAVRFLLVVLVVMLLLDFSYTNHFLLFSVIFIFSVYLIQRRMPNVESYEKYSAPTMVKSGYNRVHMPTKPYVLPDASGSGTGEIVFQSGEPNFFCNDAVTIDPPSEFAVHLNQQLTGNTANPKTKIAPIVRPPTHDLDYWKDNNLITHSHINTKGTQEDMYLSGYAVSNCCDYLPKGTEYLQTGKTVEGYCPRYNSVNQRIVSPVPAQDRVPIPVLPVLREGYCPRYKVAEQQIVSPVPAQDRVPIPVLPVLREGYEAEVRPNESGWVNTSCGYNPRQLSVNLPSNLPAGNCQQSTELSQYNKNLFTSIVTPGVYTTTQVNENPMSNLGISFQQQFEPTTCDRSEKGLMYTQHDPRVYRPEPIEPEEVAEARYDNVYDPRHSGYGTSYRSYIDPVTGQPRFFYDDVDAIRMPNYITRSKIDTFAFADTYGPVSSGNEFGNDATPIIRDLAQDRWVRDSLEFRNDLTERRMRKVNAESWQRRVAPFSANQITRRGGK